MCRCQSLLSPFARDDEVSFFSVFLFWHSTWQQDEGTSVVYVSSNNWADWFVSNDSLDDSKHVNCPLNCPLNHQSASRVASTIERAIQMPELLLNRS